jgi:hypothetical protein
MGYVWEAGVVSERWDQGYRHEEFFFLILIYYEHMDRKTTIIQREQRTFYAIRRQAGHNSLLQIGTSDSSLINSMSRED